VTDGVLNIEGVVTANVLYLNDEQEMLQSVEIEIPYVLDKKVDYQDGVVIEPNVKLFDVDIAVKRGREIYFDAKAKAMVNITTQESVCMLSKIEKLEPLQERDVALEIYFAKAGESFWEIAKNLKIPAEIIASQNSNLVDPLEKDENIAIYYRK
jgi:phospholipid N-methyltransferase